MAKKSIRGTKVELSKLLNLKRNIARMSNSYSLDASAILATCDQMIGEETLNLRQLEDLQRRANTPNFEALTRTKDLAGLLIAARLRVGWTQDKLASCVGLTRQQITRYESAKYSTVRLSKFEEITDVLVQELNNLNILGPASTSRALPDHEAVRLLLRPTT